MPSVPRLLAVAVAVVVVSSWLALPTAGAATEAVVTVAATRRATRTPRRTRIPRAILTRRGTMRTLRATCTRLDMTPTLLRLDTTLTRRPRCTHLLAPTHPLPPTLRAIRTLRVTRTHRVMSFLRATRTRLASQKHTNAVNAPPVVAMNSMTAPIARRALRNAVRLCSMRTA